MKNVDKETQEKIINLIIALIPAAKIYLVLVHGVLIGNGQILILL